MSGPTIVPFLVTHASIADPDCRFEGRGVAGPLQHRDRIAAGERRDPLERSGDLLGQVERLQVEGPRDFLALVELGRGVVG
jgi:hypothetical protein